MVIRIVIIVVLLFALDIYTFQAIKTLNKNPWIYYGYFFLCFGVLGYMIYTITAYDQSIGPNKNSLIALGLCVLFYVPKLLVVATMLIEDLVRVLIAGYHYINTSHSEIASRAYMPDRRKFLSQASLAIAAIPFTSIIYGMLKGKYNFRVLSHAIYFDDLPSEFDGFTLMQISDIHSGSLNNPKKIKYAIDLMNQQKTDVVFFTGDIVNTKAEEMTPWIEVFKKIKKPTYGKYSVLGNHDYGEYVSWPTEKAKQENFNAIKNLHKEIGFKLLLNESVFIEKETQRLAIIGVENWGHNFKKAGDLNIASKKVAPQDFKILLSHDPSHWEHEVKTHPTKYNLTLSGHTHGLQFGIEIPGVLKWSPVQYIYKQWAGLYHEMGRYIYVNRGFGFHAFPGRVGIWPEITLIQLKKKPPNA